MRYRIFEIPIDDLNEAEIRQKIASSFDRGQLFIVTPNPEMVLVSRQKPDLAEALKSASLSLADGTGLRFAVAALTDQKLKNRITGVDTVMTLAEICAEQNKRLLLLGGDLGSGEGAAQKLREKYPGLEVIAYNPGRVSEQNIDEILREIRYYQPEALAVALGQGKQETFLHRHLSMTGAKVGIGIGGAFEMISGQKKRAPIIIRIFGFEWVWRLVIEPRRVGRIARAVIVFPTVVAYTAWRENRFLTACKNVGQELIRHFRRL